MVKVNLFFYDLGNDLSLLTISFEMKTIYRIFFFFRLLFVSRCDLLGHYVLLTWRNRKKKTFFFFFFFFWKDYCVCTDDGSCGCQHQVLRINKRKRIFTLGFGYFFVFVFFFLAKRWIEWDAATSDVIFYITIFAFFLFYFFFIWKCFNIKTKERNKLKCRIWILAGKFKKKHSNQLPKK
jgi:hypothetical protein